MKFGLIDEGRQCASNIDEAERDYFLLEANNGPGFTITVPFIPAVS